MNRLPVVALIGQTNAGKSSLLNRFARKNIAIVAREEGTTRDSVSARIDDRFLMIDTAGLKDATDDFEASIQDQILDAIDSADLILLALDSSLYPSEKDKRIAKMALRSKKPVFLVLNKSDLGMALPNHEFLSLGIKPEQTFRTSATTGQGIKELKQRCLNSLFEATKENPRIFRDGHEGEQNVAGATRTALRAARLDGSENQTGFSATKKNSVASLTYDTLSMSEDWICRELNSLAKSVAKDLKSYRFAEAVEELYSTIWDKYADWFLESEKIFKNLPLLKRTLENLLIIAHPFMPFVTETIWQALSWTDGFLINQSWPTPLNFDPISAENFTRLQETVLEARRVLAGLKDAVKGVDIGLLYGDDGLIEENAELLRALTHTDKIGPTKGSPRGIRLALSGREVYLDVSDDILKVYKDALTERILSVGRELDALEKRLENPNYVAKAPAHLVEETRQGIADKTALISRLKQELTVIE